MSEHKRNGFMSAVRSFAAGYFLEAYVLILAIICLLVWARFDSLVAGGLVAVVGLVMGGFLSDKIKGNLKKDEQ
ncbi:hypothetical protein DU002_14640 [Corallincola holothuriorum]|uniref:Uncharacterized protein n=1 Tax=Corallincola holothuriorum TaxID=2282215 RepID=A0A368N819_9GAMM|nr:hypothetical protein [Corallincola holothuriorum]RCU45694.1 hypothetical protein DU002_14640 [Corallincola holothuriorum]